MTKIEVDAFIKKINDIFCRFPSFGSLENVINDKFPLEKLVENLRTFKADLFSQGLTKEDLEIIHTIKSYGKRKFDEDDLDEYVDWDMQGMVKLVVDTEKKRVHPVPKSLNHSDMAILLSLKKGVHLDNPQGTIELWHKYIVGATVFFSEEEKKMTILVSHTGIEYIMESYGIRQEKTTINAAIEILKCFLSNIKKRFPQEEIHLREEVLPSNNENIYK